jgi:hypothetical protein
MGVVLGSSTQRSEHLGQSTWTYRYVRVEEDSDGEVAIFESVERRKRT